MSRALSGSGALVTGCDLQGQVGSSVDELVGSGAELGVQVAVVRDGQLVVNVARGVADSVTGRRVTPETLFWAASTAKGVASTVAHVLAERRVLDYDMALIEVWPEFGVHGKEKVTVRHVLCHTAGVPGLPPNLTAAELCDWDHMCAVVADAEPWWEPGTRFGYHNLTFGFLIGETLRRLTGQTISELLRELITIPLGISDRLHFGVPDRLLPDTARQVAHPGGPPQPPEPGSPQARALPAALTPTAEFANRPDVLGADVPSIGTMSATGVATMYGALLGQIGQVSLVSSGRLHAMAEITYTGMDEVIGVPSQWAFGYNPYRPDVTAARPGSTFGMVGSNGSAAFADIHSRTVVAVMRNRFSVGDFALAARIDQLVAQSLGGAHDA